jgi:glucan-binding repeat-containing protein
MKKRKVFVLLTLAGLLTFSSPALTASAAWKNTSAGKMYTQTASPGYVTGLKKIKNYTYYFNSKGILQKGFQTINKKLYYFESHGRMVTGWFTLEDGKKYYADSNGVLAVDTWVGDYYFQSDGSMAVSTWVSGKWVGADGKYTGVMTNVGWLTDGGKTYYFDSNHQKVTGWLTVDGKTYYMNSSTGALMTGWITVGTKKYYAASKTGVIQTSKWVSGRYLQSDGSMAVGIVQAGKYTYCFDSSGKKRTSCWVKSDGKYYYFNSKGVMLKKKWVEKKYYVTADGSRASGFTTISKKTYYFASNGLRKTGWLTVDGQRYWLNSSGVLQTGRWLWSKKYYASNTGAVLKGLNAVGKYLYYFNTTTGLKLTSSLKTIGSDTYYFQKNGTAAKNKWVKISSKYYYFQSTGKMAKNTWVGNYYVGSNGARTSSTKTTGWTTVGSSKYYFDSNGNMATGFTTINGSTYYFNSSGVMLTGIQTIGNVKYYFYSSGEMAVSTVLAVSTKQYTINEKGVVTKEETLKVTESNLGSKIVNYALQFVGNPYVYGGNSLTNGVDCSGFTQQVYKYFGISIPRVADNQMKGTENNVKYSFVTVDVKSMQPGDLIFYGSGNYATHVAIYIGNGNIVHASNSQPYPKGGIKISNYNYATPIRVVRYWS